MREEKLDAEIAAFEITIANLARVPHTYIWHVQITCCMSVHVSKEEPMPGLASREPLHRRYVDKGRN